MSEKLTMSQLEERIAEIVVKNVTPLLEEHKLTLGDVQKEVDEKIAEITGQLATRPMLPTGDLEEKEDPKGGFKSMSHFFKDVQMATVQGLSRISKELGEWSRKAADSTTLEEGDDQYGGFLIPPEFKNELWLAVEQQSMIIQRTTNIPIAHTTIKIPYINGFDESGGLVYGGIQWSWLDELADKTPTRPKIGRITLDLKKLAGLAYASEEILADSPISMENILKKGFADGLTFTLNDVLLRGGGAGRPLGILNAPCLVSVPKETGQAANTIVYENLLKMISRHSSSGSAVWMANQDCLPQLGTMALSVGTGGTAVWIPSNGAAGAPLQTLMGLPLIWNKHCSTVGDVGDLILADWSQYLIGLKGGQGATGQFDTSMHVQFVSDQIAFRFVFRIDGQPWWPSALTPPQSSDTLSPFIVLAAR